MSTFTKTARITQGALLLSALLTGVATAQQPASAGRDAPLSAPAATTSTTVVAAPAPSPLFAQASDQGTTIAAAQADHAAAAMPETHVIGVSTLVLVLVIVILVLLIT